MDPGVAYTGGIASEDNLFTSRVSMLVERQLLLHSLDHPVIVLFLQSTWTLCFSNQGRPRMISCLPIGATSRGICSKCLLMVRLTFAVESESKNFSPVTETKLKIVSLLLVGMFFWAMKRGWMKFPIAPESMNAWVVMSSCMQTGM